MFYRSKDESQNHQNKKKKKDLEEFYGIQMIVKKFRDSFILRLTNDGNEVRTKIREDLKQILLKICTNTFHRLILS